MQIISTAIREFSRDIPSNEWLPCATAYCVFTEVYYDVLKMQRKQYYHFSNDECRDFTSWSTFWHNEECWLRDAHQRRINELASEDEIAEDLRKAQEDRAREPDVEEFAEAPNEPEEVPGWARMT